MTNDEKYYNEEEYNRVDTDYFAAAPAESDPDVDVDVEQTSLFPLESDADYFKYLKI